MNFLPDFQKPLKKEKKKEKKKKMSECLFQTKYLRKMNIVGL